ncbi:MAG: (2Fe-2S)-binding protein [Lentisphaerota bacterium]
MAEKITFKVNGVQRSADVEGSEKLIELLRNDLELTGTKRGCDDATCGACVVVVNGEAVKSCVFPVSKLKDAEVWTVEGVSTSTSIHPIQQALIEAGAVQCGYCMPGIVMHLFALYNRNVNASEEEIVEVLSQHFCRCTGYEAIFEGALLAQKYLREKKS